MKERLTSGSNANLPWSVLQGNIPSTLNRPWFVSMHHGFITPVPLHYVRQPWSCSNGTWQDWTVEVCGLVKRPVRFTMEQLVNEFPARELPVTLVCAVWRGVPLHLLLKKCGIYSRKNGAINVCFEGAETCQVAVESKDNRVLPSHVDAELANAEAWWYKTEYIINELNINSAITTPSHEEILPINSWTTQRPFTLKATHIPVSGGKKVTRAEVTLDGGETWRVCNLDHPEKPNKYGKYWCWCFWSLEVEILELLGAKEIAVRAWDETLNTQPEKLNWNVMGMMNNCWFRVKTNVCKRHKGEIGIVFEHPTVPGNQSGGWMAKERHLENSSENIRTLKKSVSTPFMNTSSKAFSMAEVKKHKSAESAWIIVHGHVYDCTRFLKYHPGGTDSILINAWY
ncbi:nitrate reductase [Populus alba x Populus x berolinensis]|nr:nitrate reductase [Populus alba x Populus x berolinensis]